MSNTVSIHPTLSAGDESPDGITDVHPASSADDNSVPSDKDRNDDKTRPGTSLPQEDSRNSVPPSKTAAEQGKRTLSVIILQLIVFAILLGVSVMHSWLHNLPSVFDFMARYNVEKYYEAIADYNFVGVGPGNPEPSLMAVLIEVILWSAIGVLARSEYYLTQLVIGRQDFRLLEVISKLIGDLAMGMAIAMAIVAFLRSTEFVNLSLKTADIGAIIAISFILGFYHEDARRLLGSFQRTISGVARKTGEDKVAK